MGHFAVDADVLLAQALESSEMGRSERQAAQWHFRALTQDHFKQRLMGVAVVAGLTLAAGQQHGRLASLLVLAHCHVQVEDVLGVLLIARQTKGTTEKERKR